MRRLMILALALAVPLAACDGGGIASAGTAATGAVLDTTVATKPADVANKTVLDEAIGIGATNAYTAASRLGTALARGDLIDKAAFKAADQKGFEAVTALRAAYLAGNATSYSAGINRAYAAASAIAALVK